MYSVELKEVILFLFDEIKKAEYQGATEYKVLKLLYKLKEELPIDHSLKNSIPFYWYFHGPFSDPVRSELNELQGQYLKKEHYRGYQLLNLIQEREFDSDIIDIDVQKITHNLMEGKIFFNIERMVYDENAPYKFMPYYKFDFLDTLKSYEQTIKNGEENSDLIEKAIETCYDCESKLTSNPYYLKYEDLFSKFLTNIDKLNRNELWLSYFTEIKQEAQSVWNTFGNGVRVKHHDNYYNSSELDWDKHFKSELNLLDLSINRLSKIARKSSRKEKVKFSETSKRILSSTLGTYLTCDNNG
jgi:hypothetical protein